MHPRETKSFCDATPVEVDARPRFSGLRCLPSIQTKARPRSVFGLGGVRI